MRFFSEKNYSFGRVMTSLNFLRYLLIRDTRETNEVRCVIVDICTTSDKDPPNGKHFVESTEFLLVLSRLFVEYFVCSSHNILILLSNPSPAYIIIIFII